MSFDKRLEKSYLVALEDNMAKLQERGQLRIKTRDGKRDS